MVSCGYLHTSHFAQLCTNCICGVQSCRFCGCSESFFFFFLVSHQDSSCNDRTEKQDDVSAGVMCSGSMARAFKVKYVNIGTL